MRELDPADLAHWHRHGYVIVEDVLSSHELEAVHADLRSYMPTWDEFVTRRPLFADLRGSSTRTPPGWVRHEFPYAGDALNHVAAHPFLVAFTEAIVGHSRIAMSHGAIVGKYAGFADYDQDLHPDYTNNTLVFPRQGVTSIDIPMIVYHTDVTVDLGPTYVVSQEHTAGLIQDGRRHHSRAEFPEIYECESPATLRAGSALIYNMRTFHRGSAMTASQGVRFSQFVAFHTTGEPWLGSNSFQGAGGSPNMDRFLTKADPRQRQLVGFPGPDDPYWDDPEARIAVANRYPEMDMSVYRSSSTSA
jgi:ectoine hydroxylase-related dioxygenase (phytanoyl-CoA dioxygenase family)